jgi:hypothetical protein
MMGGFRPGSGRKASPLARRHVVKVYLSADELSRAGDSGWFARRAGLRGELSVEDLKSLLRRSPAAALELGIFVDANGEADTAHPLPREPE